MKSEKLRTNQLLGVANSATLHFSLLISHSRRGQVALYLLAVLVAICVLMIMNVGIYLAISTKNKVMNAGDAAALAVANYQGELLNRIGQWNLDHLQAALDNDEELCGLLITNKMRCCFLGPVNGEAGGNPTYPYGAISAGNQAAKNNGAERCKDVEKLLRDHVNDIRNYYAQNPDAYPPPWEPSDGKPGAWEEYADTIANALGEGVWAGPDNIDFVDAAGGHVLLDRQFYNAVAGRNWCWFKFNAPGLLDSYETYRSWERLPGADGETRARRCMNSEVYSLNLRMRTGSAVDLLGTNLIIRLTGATLADIKNSYVITNRSQVWMFYDNNVWRNWWELDPYGPWRFPVVGQVREEYNVRGCAAMCRVYRDCPDLIGGIDREGLRDVFSFGNDGGEDDYRQYQASDKRFAWTAAAKPFGTVENEDGEVDVVTANRNFVTPAFEQSRLVPIDGVGGKDISTADADWMSHVQDHLPRYLPRDYTRREKAAYSSEGLAAILGNGCWYCEQLVVWENAAFRQSGSNWLKFHGNECVRPLPGSGSTGGTPHGH